MVILKSRNAHKQCGCVRINFLNTRKLALSAVSAQRMQIQNTLTMFYR